jgi:hypothetical protein
MHPTVPLRFHKQNGLHQLRARVLVYRAGLRLRASFWRVDCVCRDSNIVLKLANYKWHLQRRRVSYTWPASGVFTTVGW